MPNGNDETIIEAQKLADIKAQKKTDLTGKYQAPDYSPKNLIKLGAKQTFKNVLYVEIRRIGAKDFRSMQATEQHKQQFENEFNQFLAENKADENIREEREVVRINTSGQNNNKAEVSTGFGSFSYSFTI